MTKPMVICFAGTPGCGKTQLASYLSEQAGLPILSRNDIRAAVKTELNVDDLNEELALAEFEKRYSSKLEHFLADHLSFIHDSGVERRWAEMERQFSAAGYHYVLISFDLPKADLLKKYQEKNYPPEHFEGYIAQFKSFLEKYGDKVSLKLDETNYEDRYKLALKLI